MPLGTTTPPFTLLNLYRILSSCVKSKLEFNVSVNVFCAPDAEPLGLIAFAIPASFLIPNPGLLSLYDHLEVLILLFFLLSRYHFHEDMRI